MTIRDGKAQITTGIAIRRMLEKESMMDIKEGHIITGRKEDTGMGDKVTRHLHLQTGTSR